MSDAPKPHHSLSNPAVDPMNPPGDDFWSKTTLLTYFVLFPLLSLTSFVLDDGMLAFAAGMRAPSLDIVFTPLTNFIVLAFLFVIIPALFLLYRRKMRSAFLLFGAFLISCTLSLILKFAVARTRPEASEFIFEDIVSYSFPSMHALVLFALLPLLFKEFPRLKVVIGTLATLIAFTRIYFSVHYFSDVMVGGILGYVLGSILLQYAPENMPAFSLLKHRHFEMQRKMFHILLGVFLAILISADALPWQLLGAITLIGFIISLLERRFRIPLFSSLLDRFERENVRWTFPGEGLLFYLLGSFFAVLLFPKDVALASIMILAFGDSFSHLFGIHFGSIRNPLTDRKHLEGAAAGFAAGYLAALVFVGSTEAFIASFAAMLFESLELKIRHLRIDDNVVLPVVAGGSIMLFRLAFGG